MFGYFIEEGGLREVSFILLKEGISSAAMDFPPFLENLHNLVVGRRECFYVGEFRVSLTGRDRTCIHHQRRGTCSLSSLVL